MEKRNAADAGYLRPNTVLVTRDGVFRIGQDLLGDNAGRRDLKFTIAVNGRSLSLTPAFTAGWPVHYSNAHAKSPRLRLTRFFRLVQMKPPEPGEYKARRVGEKVVFRFDRRERKR